MFCNQCEQTAKGKGCTVKGVCGKEPSVAALQDALLHVLQGISIYAVEARKKGINEIEANRFTAGALFATLTNVNFDERRFQQYIGEGAAIRDRLKERILAEGGSFDLQSPSIDFVPKESLEALIRQGEEMGLPVDDTAGDDIRSLQMTVLFGIKGVAAYAYHARILGKEDDRIYQFLHQALASMAHGEISFNEWVSLVLKTGEINLVAMELLDRANTGRYGSPRPTRVPLGHLKGKSILVSGHDLKDLDELLRQTAGKGIHVYTHGEMLPAHGYPELKKYPHFYGHYGTAWQNQRKDFSAFPGAILMTTNCIQKPADSYGSNIFTTGTVGWPGATHVKGGDFSPVINRALEMEGFSSDEEKGSVTVGFAHDAVLGVADKVIEAVKKGDIKHFFLVGGCDGAKPGRSYYSEFVEKVPTDSVVLTLACGKFRFFHKDLGEIGGLPRLMDMGQCNDAYSAIKVAGALAEAFGCTVNELPLSLVLSWYEQKAVAILLSLLHLGIKDIRLGPSLPAFITPKVLDVLVENFAIKPVTTPDEDLAAILG